MKVLEQETERAVKYAGETIKQVLIDSTKRMWYSEHSPEQYQRTYDILNSISLDAVKTGKGGYTATVYFDEDKIRMQAADGWNQHMSVDGSTSYGGRPIASWVVEWVSFGQNSSIFSYEGGGHIQATQEFAKADAVYLIEESLRKAGFETVVVR